MEGEELGVLGEAEGEGVLVVEVFVVDSGSLSGVLVVVLEVVDQGGAGSESAEAETLLELFFVGLEGLGCGGWRGGL